MHLDALASGILAFFVLTGAWVDSLATSMRLLALIGSYALSLALAGTIGDRFTIADPLRVAVAGAVVFTVASVVLSGIARWVRRVERRWGGDVAGQPLDRAGGALVGVMRGALIVVLVGVLGQWVEALQVTGQLDGLPIPDGGDSAVVAAKIRKLTSSPRISALERDALFWSYVSNGAYDAALNQASFLGITDDASTRSDLASLGMISEEAAADPSPFRSAAREVLTQVGPRLRHVREDPALEELARDPEIGRALKDGDGLSLLRKREPQALVSRVMASES